ncbi:hypothetical protein HME9304_03054 [Flagellimonas maritima]|uniref:Uncharacterized protein n=1 Tax=Flagellimonas maritima TaxID=1383885 RepID=A0A2Z4LW72_9FLAO|nr:hypothetical protein [Allomuricauda aurantiaca]AWX46022.1 hypothetical protein HME9304_03054 [Allomuricauda aurantiaca]
MKRILIDYKKLDHKVAAILIDSYPHGYGDEDIMTLKKPSGEIIEAVEVKTNDTIYLVKISKSLSNFISNFEEIIEKELEKSDGVKDDLKSDLPVNREFETDSDIEIEGLY